LRIYIFSKRTNLYKCYCRTPLHVERQIFHAMYKMCHRESLVIGSCAASHAVVLYPDLSHTRWSWALFCWVILLLNMTD